MIKQIARFLSLLLLLSAFITYGQQKFTVSGYIKDKKNGEDLIGVTVFVKETNEGTSTNSYGFYSVTLPEGKYTFSYTYVGYKTILKEIDLTSNQKLSVEIEEDKVQLEEIEVTAERSDANVKSPETSVNKLSIREISKMPALLGEVDVIRSIQLLPGVSTVGEGASGFNVRGGSIDQNLVLLDQAHVYNTSHLFGFFSVFNPDAVKDVKLYKGGIPAQYGGRLSSLLDVHLKEGNSKRVAAQGGLGIIFSRLTIEAPIKKDKGSFIIAARRSYADVLAQPALASNQDLKGLQLYFYDLTMKANYTLGKKDKIYLSGYLGRDVFGVSSFGFNWGNTTLSFRWNHLFNDRLFMNVVGLYSKYDYQLGAETGSNGDSFNWKSSIINYSVRPDFTYYVNTKNTINFGGQAIFYTFVPGTSDFTTNGKTITRTLPDKYALENALYISDELTVTPRLTITYGLRVSNFQYYGPGIKQTYAPSTTLDQPKELINEETYTTGQVIQSYVNPEPRASVKYELNENSSVKSSYMRTAQYLQLISNTAASIPLDVWTPSTNNIKPQLADQFTLGYFRNFGKNNDYEASLEGFYKIYQNQVDYVTGADLILNPQLEGSLLTGKGRAYGLEFFLKKNSGRLTGWISYTLSRSERQIDGINQNKWYPIRFDKTHNLNIVASYELNKRWSMASNIVYGSGTPVNLPTNKGTYDGYVFGTNPSEPRNNYRIPDYFRIDLTATLKSNRKKYKEEEIPTNFFKAMKYRYEWEIVFGVYNLLGRRNAFAIYPQQDSEVSNQTQFVKFSLFGFVIPAFTYNFKF